MRHLRPEERALRHRRSDCRKGRHNYGERQSVGAGIIRQVCLTCSAVTIDLTSPEAAELSPTPGTVRGPAGR